MMARWLRQRQRARDAAAAAVEVRAAVLHFNGVELIAAASGAERCLLRVARDGGRNAWAVEREAEETAKELKLQWLAAQQPDVLEELRLRGATSSEGCPEEYCSCKAWRDLRYLARMYHNDSIGTRRERRRSKAGSVDEWFNELVDAESDGWNLLEEEYPDVWPGIQGWEEGPGLPLTPVRERTAAQDFARLAGRAEVRAVASATERLAKEVDRATVEVLGELWRPSELWVELEHISRLPTGSSAPGGRRGGGGAGAAARGRRGLRRIALLACTSGILAAAPPARWVPTNAAVGLAQGAGSMLPAAAGWLSPRLLWPELMGGRGEGGTGAVVKND